MSLSESPHIQTLPELTSYLGLFTAAQKRRGHFTQLALVTYNRVGDGRLRPRTTFGKLDLDIYSGSLGYYVTPDQILRGEEVSPRLTDEQVANFFQNVNRDLAPQISRLDHYFLMIAYAGGVEKFQMALNLIHSLSVMSAMAGKQDIVKFYLLTCRCDLAAKAKVSWPLYCSEGLRSVVYNPTGVCGGISDLKAIADKALNAAHP